MTIVTSCEKSDDFKTDSLPEAKLYSLSSERGAISIDKETGKQSVMFSIGLESSGYDYKKSVVLGNIAYSVSNDELTTFDFGTNSAQVLAKLPNKGWNWNLGLINNKLHALVCSRGIIPNLSLVEINEMTGGITHKADFGSMLNIIPTNSDHTSVSSWIYSSKTNTIIASAYSTTKPTSQQFCKSYILTVDLATEKMLAGIPYTTYNPPITHFIERKGEIYVSVNAQSYSKLFLVDLRYLALSSKVVATFHNVNTIGGVCYDSKADIMYMYGRYLTSYSMATKRIKYLDAYNENTALVLVQ